MEFNHSGELLATGDKGGRVVIFQQEPEVRNVNVLSEAPREAALPEGCVEVSLIGFSETVRDAGGRLSFTALLLHLLPGNSTVLRGEGS